MPASSVMIFRCATGNIPQPAGLRKSAAMITRYAGHGHDFLPRPSHNAIQVADHSLGALVMVFLAGKPADFVDHGSGLQQLA